MVTSSINISSAGNPAINTTTSVSSGMPQIRSQKIGVSMTISDTDGNQATASLNLNSSSLKLEILKSQEYQKQASLFFGSLFSGGFNAEYMWSLLAAPTNEQINGSHLTSALSGIHSDISSLADAFQLHYNNWNIHLSTEDRDFLTRLKGLYGGVYNVALDYLILVNPYNGDITLSENQIALFAGWGGFSAYAGLTDVELEFFNILCIPTKSGGFHTPQAYAENNNTYGYGITTLNIPTNEPLDLVEGETAIYVGEGGFNSVSDGNSDVEVIVGYYYQGAFYLDSSHLVLATCDDKVLYIDISSNKLYRYDETESAFIPLSADTGLIKGYYNTLDGNFYETLNGNSYTGLIEAKEGALYLDLTDNILYRYDHDLDEYVAVSSVGNGNSFFIRGYRNSTDGKFYTDALYEEEITGDLNSLYYDLLTSQIYYYTSSNVFDRLHHKVSLDYLLLNTNYSDTITPGQNQIALFIGEGGFDAQSIGTGEEDEVVIGYYYNNGFYKEAAHTTLITPNSESLFIDLATNTLYIYKSGDYIQASSAGGSSSSGTNTVLGYINSNVFYLTRTGNQGSYTYSNSVEPDINSVYIDRATGVFYKYIGSAYVAQTTQTILSQGYDLSISHSTSDLNQWTIEHSAFTNINYPSTSGADGDLVSGLSFDVHNNLYYGHIAGVSTTPFSKSATANYIVQRTATDAAIKSNYLILTKNPTLSESLANTEVALFEGPGGFTAISYNGNHEYYAGTGLYLNPVNDEFSVKLDYVTNGVNYGVRSGAGGLYVTVPNSGGSGGSGGTMDHSNLTNRFSTDFPSGAVVYQHDIGVINGLQAALDNLNTAIGNNATAITTINTNLGKIDPTTWSAEAPVLFSHTSTTENDITTYSNRISLSALSETIAATETSANGYILSSASSYIESASGRTITKTPVAYDNRITNGTLVKRRNDGALAATYLLITDGISGSASVASGESAIYIGSGGYDAQSANDNYYMYTSWPSSLPSAGEDSVISARAIYQKIQELSIALNPYDDTILSGRVSTLETSLSNIINTTLPSYESRINVLEGRDQFILVYDYPTDANMIPGILYVQIEPEATE